MFIIILTSNSNLFDLYLFLFLSSSFSFSKYIFIFHLIKWVTCTCSPNNNNNHPYWSRAAFIQIILEVNIKFKHFCSLLIQCDSRKPESPSLPHSSAHIDVLYNSVWNLRFARIHKPKSVKLKANTNISI